MVLKDTGFTLTEMAVTAVIVGVVMTIALPNFSTTAEKSRASEAIQVLSAIWQAQQVYQLENNGAVAGAIADLDVDIQTPSNFNNPVLYTANNHTAYIDRTNGDFRLYIEDDNDITCDDTPGNAGICARMGFAAYPY